MQSLHNLFVSVSLFFIKHLTALQIFGRSKTDCRLTTQVFSAGCERAYHWVDKLPEQIRLSLNESLNKMLSEGWTSVYDWWLHIDNMTPIVSSLFAFVQIEQNR